MIRVIEPWLTLMSAPSTDQTLSHLLSWWPYNANVSIWHCTWLLVAPASPGTTRSCRAITNWCVYYIIYTYCALRPVTILYSQVTGEPLVISWRNHKVNERHVFFISLPFISHKWWVTWILTLVLSWTLLFPRLLILWSIYWWVRVLPLEGHRGWIVCSVLQGCFSSIVSSWSSSWLAGN